MLLCSQEPRDSLIVTATSVRMYVQLQRRHWRQNLTHCHWFHNFTDLPMSCSRLILTLTSLAYQHAVLTTQNTTTQKA
jgi:hypothetical protein